MGKSKKRGELVTLKEAMKILGAKSRETIEKKVSLAQAAGKMPQDESFPTMLAPDTGRPCRGFSPEHLELLRKRPKAIRKIESKATRDR